MMKSFEEEATKELLKLTAKSVMSPFTKAKQIHKFNHGRGEIIVRSSKCKETEQTHFMSSATGQAKGSLH